MVRSEEFEIFIAFRLSGSYQLKSLLTADY